MQSFKSRMATSLPDGDFARELSRAVTRLIKDLFAEYFANAEEALGESFDDLRAFVGKISNERRLPPELFYVAYHLRVAIETQNADLVYDWLCWLSRMSKRRSGKCPPFVSSILSEDWEHYNVDEMRLYDQRDICDRGTIVWPILDHRVLAFHRRNITSALELVRRHDSEQAREFDEFVHCIRLFQGRVLRGETSARSFGAVWLRVPEKEQDQVAYWIEHLIHELAHLRLEAVFMYGQVVLNPLSENRFRAPIRDDPRPMRGVFHATFVLARIIRIFRRLSIAGMDKRLRDPLRLFELQFEIGMETLNLPDAKLSAVGRRIRDSLVECCKS